MDSKLYAKPWLDAIQPYTPGVMKEGYVKLASNENNYGPSPEVIEAIRDAADDVYRYPYRGQLVYEAAAEYAGVEADQVLYGNGSDELIDMTLKTFQGPAAGFAPSFPEYRICSQILGVDYSEVPLKEDFSFDADGFLAGTRDAKLLFLCSPNNPTGGVISRDDIIKILDAGRMTVVDEAYYEFYGETVVDLIKDYPNLIVYRTLSKAFGLGGLRIGYALAQASTISLLKKVRPPFNVSMLAEAAAVAAFSELSWMREKVGWILRDRGKMAEALSRKYRVFPSEANFVFVDVSPQSAEDVYNSLLEKKIIVRRFGRIEGFPGEYIRVTVGTGDETKLLLDALKE